MMQKVDHLFDTIFSKNSQKKFEKYILLLAAGGFVAHLILIFLNIYGFVNIEIAGNLLSNPISALYTPFSFILVYEAFLLIYYITPSVPFSRPSFPSNVFSHRPPSYFLCAYLRFCSLIFSYRPLRSLLPLHIPCDSLLASSITA